MPRHYDFRTVVIVLSMLAACTGAVAAAQPGGEGGPALPAAECGHGLEMRQAIEGWISLFDGQTDFGWRDARAGGGRLIGGRTATRFKDYEVRAEIAAGGMLRLGDEVLPLEPGPVTVRRRGTAGTIGLEGELAVTSLAIRPLGMETILDGGGLAGWKRVDRAEGSNPAAWQAGREGLRATGGPSAMEYTSQRYGDFILQLEARTIARHTNGGLFFRSQPGLFMMGYEAQIYHRCQGGDPGRPWRYSTGAIDDRQMARRLVSRDDEVFVLTVVADGNQLATWVNGFGMTDWGDDRPPRDNPREGLRLDAGTIQLQSHDPQTDLLFRQLRVAAFDNPERG